jgi:hypothetical protein
MGAPAGSCRVRLEDCSVDNRDPSFTPLENITESSRRAHARRSGRFGVSGPQSRTRGLGEPAGGSLRRARRGTRARRLRASAEQGADVACARARWWGSPAAARRPPRDREPADLGRAQIRAEARSHGRRSFLLRCAACRPAARRFPRQGGRGRHDSPPARAAPPSQGEPTVQPTFRGPGRGPARSHVHFVRPGSRFVALFIARCRMLLVT